MPNHLPIIPYFRQDDAEGLCSLRLKNQQSSYPAHGHDYLELELFLSGRGRQWVNNVQVPFGTGSLFLLSPEDHHRVEVEESADILAIHLRPESIAALGLPEIRAAYMLTLPPEQMRRWTETMLPLAGQEGRPWHAQEVTAVAAQLIIRLLREGRCIPLAAPGKRLQNALKYVQQHHADPTLRLTEVAAACGLSPTWFSRVFTEAVGCHYADYVQDCRLQHACILLKTTSATVTEIAYEVGFAGLPHFFRAFRQKMGCTPAEYRKAAK